MKPKNHFVRAAARPRAKRLPLTREHCANIPRPCPHVSCRHHIYLDVVGKDIIRNSAVPLWEMTDSCSLDVAERGGVTLETVAELMGVTTDGARKIQERALLKLDAIRDMEALRDWIDDSDDEPVLHLVKVRAA